jgi:hypothetical protein
MFGVDFYTILNIRKVLGLIATVATNPELLKGL